MKISDFKFRIVKPQRASGGYHSCNNPECKCNHPFIYGDEAFYRLSEFLSNEELREKWQIELWSGLYDSEGKEVYEGDILKENDGHEWIVIYNTRGFEVYSKGLGENHSLFAFTLTKRAKIIGNIHEEAKE